jgi:hypothetical protein
MWSEIRQNLLERIDRSKLFRMLKDPKLRGEEGEDRRFRTL